MDDWKTRFLLGWPIFRVELLVSGSVILQLFSAGESLFPTLGPLKVKTEEVDMMVPPTGYDGKVTYKSAEGARNMTQSERRRIALRKPTTAQLYLEGLRERWEQEDRIKRVGKMAADLEQAVREDKKRSAEVETEHGNTMDGGGLPSSSSKAEKVPTGIFSGSQYSSGSSSSATERPVAKSESPVPKMGNPAPKVQAAWPKVFGRPTFAKPVFTPTVLLKKSRKG